MKRSDTRLLVESWRNLINENLKLSSNLDNSLEIEQQHLDNVLLQGILEKVIVQLTLSEFYIEYEDDWQEGVGDYTDSYHSGKGLLVKKGLNTIIEEYVATNNLKDEEYDEEYDKKYSVENFKNQLRSRKLNYKNLKVKVK